MLNKADMFVTPLFWKILKEFDNKELVNFALKLEKEDNGNIVSNRGGFQSHSWDHYNLPAEMQTLVETVELAIKPHTYMTGFNRELKLANCWINVNGKHTYNCEHEHPGSLMSCVFYIKVPSNCGKIEFMRNDGHRLVWGDNSLFSTWNNVNSTLYYMEPKENLFLMFPSYVSHRVEMNTTEDEDDKRISIALNFN